jgi:hypothetical protein
MRGSARLHIPKISCRKHIQSEGHRTLCRYCRRCRKTAQRCPSVNLQTALKTLDSTNWTTAVKNFAWSCTANCLPSGYSCSRSKHDRCPICGTAAQSVYHEIANCPQLKAARQWLAEVTRKTASSIPAFVIYAHHRTLANQRNVIALRECFYAQWRAQRNAAISGHKSTRDQVRDNLKINDYGQASCAIGPVAHRH